MSKFKLPEKPAQPATNLESWVAGAAEPSAEAVPKASAGPAGGKTARLTIDLPQELHARFKATCAMNGTRMIDEVRTFIEDWTQKHR